MAALQTIRNRGSLLVSIVIGLALIAFIVGDALSSGSQAFDGDRNQVGEIDGKSISIIDYQNRVSKNEETAKMMSNSSALNEEQQATIRNSAWQQMVMENLMQKEYDEIGLTISSDELYDLLLGENMSPIVSQQFADPTTGMVDKEQAKMIIAQLMSAPANSPQKMMWLNIEEEVHSSSKIAKYNTLLAKSLYITDEQAKESAEATASKSDISYIVKNYNTISDSSIQVSDSEITTYYNDNKNKFKQAESRRIVYVNFDIEPSGEDFIETEKALKDLVGEFAETNEALNFVNLSSDVNADNAYYRKDEISNDSLAEFLFESETGVFGPYLENNSYKIARVANVRMLPDSVRARHILIAPQNNDYVQAKAIADSLADLLKKGGDFEELARTNSTDQNSAINGGDLGWFNQKAMVQPFSDTAFFAKKKEIKVVLTQFGAHILQVTDRAKPVEKIQIATIEKEVVSSAKTTNNIYNNARSFATGLTNLDDFNKKVAETALTKRMATVDKQEATIAGMSSAREMIRYIYMTNEVGIVNSDDESVIFENGNTYSVAVLTEINEEGFSPISTVSGEIKSILVQKKKAEQIAKELVAMQTGSESLLSIAQKAGEEVKEANDISFNSYQIPGAGMEPKVIAAATVLEQGKISAPIAGSQGVFVLVVNNRTTEEITPENIQQTKVAMQQSNMYRANYQAIQAIVENGNVIDQRYKFY